MIQLNCLTMEGDLNSLLNLDSEEIPIPPEAFYRAFEAIPPSLMDQSFCMDSRYSQQLYGYNDRDFAPIVELPSYPRYLPFNFDSYLQINTPKTEGEESSSVDQEKDFDSGQNLISFQLQPQTEQNSNEANYHRGHIDFLRQLSTPIFLQSRKFCKSKKKMSREKTYYKVVGKHMKAKKGKSCKRFDQYYLQQQFKKLGVKEQEEKEATLEAIRHLKKHHENADNTELLEKHKKKYLLNRKWAIFLHQFVNSEQ